MYNIITNELARIVRAERTETKGVTIQLIEGNECSGLRITHVMLTAEEWSALVVAMSRN